MTLEEFLSEWNNGSDRVLVHTSGSTGKPKPMLVEKKRMLNSARITCDFLGLKPGDSALLCMSLDYIAGKMVVVRSIERHLHLISVCPSGHPLKDVNEEITFAAMVPMQVYNTLQVPEERARLCRIRHLIIGGGAIDEALEQKLKALPGDIAIWSTYGMTETLSHIALRRINGDEASEWYQPFDSVKISQTDEGCLVIDAPQVCAEPLVTNDIVEIESYIYNKVIVATDADVDGMHIRLLIITFFLQFFPDLIKKGHVYVLQTPLFRVRNKRTKIKNKQAVADADAKLGPKEKKGDFITHYCYSDEERQQAIKALGPDPEITRFKGLGEISPEEFAHFIGPDMRLEQVTLHKTDQVQKLLEYYMGKNTMERQNFIIDNLVIEEDIPEEDSAPLD